MPKPVHKQHRHDLPTQLVPVISGGDDQNLPIPHDQATEIECPNNDRIAEIERRLDQRISALDNKVEAIAIPAPVQVVDGGLEEHTQQQIAAMLRQVETLRSQVETIADKPQLTPDQVNGLASGFDARVQKLVDAAVSTVRDEIQRVKIEVSSVKRSSATDLAEQVELLGNMVTETGKLVVHLSDRGSELERNVNDTKTQLGALRAEFLGDLSATLQTMVNTLETKAA